MQLSRMWAVLAGGLVAAALEGCGGDAPAKHPDVAPAAGVLSYGDKPFPGAVIVLQSVQSLEKGWSCSGFTDADGKFEMKTQFAPGTAATGVVPGDYVATVAKTESAPVLSAEESKARQARIDDRIAKKLPPDEADVQQAPKSLVPKKYESAATSDLKVTIDKAGKKDIVWKMAD